MPNSRIATTPVNSRYTFLSNFISKERVCKHSTHDSLRNYYTGIQRDPTPNSHLWPKFGKYNSSNYRPHMRHHIVAQLDNVQKTLCIIIPENPCASLCQELKLSLYRYTIHSRAKSTLSTNCTFYIRECSILQKNIDPSKKLYLRTVPNFPNVLHIAQPKSENTDETTQPPENGEIQKSPNFTSPTSTNFERIIAYAAEVKFINNRYTTPITVEFGSSESENSVNLLVNTEKSSSRLNSSTPNE